VEGRVVIQGASGEAAVLTSLALVAGIVVIWAHVLITTL
jgi:hypothetical protein